MCYTCIQAAKALEMSSEQCRETALAAVAGVEEIPAPSIADYMAMATVDTGETSGVERLKEIRVLAKCGCVCTYYPTSALAIVLDERREELEPCKQEACGFEWDAARACAYEWVEEHWS